MTRLTLAAACVLAASPIATAQTVTVRVTAENLAAPNGVSFAPLRVGFHNGTFDAFDINAAPGAAIISIAEGGVGDVWFDEFATVDPGATLGTVGGPLVPAANVSEPFVSTATANFVIDTDANPFFTFANMVIPSNDLFLGNDNPIQLFDAVGNLQFTQIDQFGSSIWDANSEQAIVANGAFVPGSDNSARVPEGGNVEFDFSELAVYDGVTTAAGYDFDFSTVTSGASIFRISFAIVPEPTTIAALAMTPMLLLRRARR